MDRFEEGVRSGVVMLDAGVVHDIATTLTGDWQPESVADPDRRAQMLAAARVRLFADRERYGWYLATTTDARESAMGYKGAEWSVGFIQDVSTMENAPPVEDVLGLEKLFREAGIVGASAKCLAYGMLYDRVSYVLSSNPHDLKHSREHDLPGRLEVVTPQQVIERMGIVEGEEPAIGPPQGSELDSGPHFWIL